MPRDWQKRVTPGEATLEMHHVDLSKAMHEGKLTPLGTGAEAPQEALQPLCMPMSRLMEDSGALS